MAKKTREVTHYEVYTVRRSYTTKREVTRMEEVAIFDDKVLAEAYIKARKASPMKEKDVKSEQLEIQASWTEQEPVPSNFSLPFNPKWDDSTEAESKVVKSTKKPTKS
jgi:hypothetical protein